MHPETTDALTIRDMAARSGLSEHTLRYYERIGLIRPIPRDTSSGHRRYSPETAEAVESLAHLRAAGLPLEDMRTFLVLRAQGHGAAAEQKALFAAHRTVVEKEIGRQQRRLKYLEGKVAYWEAVEAGDAAAVARITEAMPGLAKELNR